MQATLRHHLAMLQREDPTFIEQVISSLYVDDLASGDNDEDETFRLYRKLQDRLSAGGFNMRKFLTNSASPQRHIDEAEGIKQFEPAAASEEACEDNATCAKVSVNNQPPHALDSYDNDDDETFRLYRKLKDRFSAGGFNMRKFLTNSASPQRLIDEAEGIKQLEPAAASEEACEDDATCAKVSVNNQPPHALDSYDNVLGVALDRQADNIVIDMAACFEFSAVSERPTKRGVASQVARLFDPLGLVPPLTVRLKRFLQQLHTTGLAWDERLLSDQEQRLVNVPAAVSSSCSAGSSPAMLLHSGAGRVSVTPWMQRRIGSRFCSCCISMRRGRRFHGAARHGKDQSGTHSQADHSTTGVTHCVDSGTPDAFCSTGPASCCLSCRSTIHCQQCNDTHTDDFLLFVPDNNHTTQENTGGVWFFIVATPKHQIVVSNHTKIRVE